MEKINAYQPESSHLTQSLFLPPTLKYQTPSYTDISWDGKVKRGDIEISIVI